MKRLIAAAVALLVLAASASSQTALPADLRLALIQPKDFQLRTSLSKIPDTVRVAFAKAIGDGTFFMAEPGAKWQAGYEVKDTRLPRRRLQRALLSKSFCVLFYESGGRRKNNHVAFFRLTEAGAEFVGSTGNSYPPVFDLRRLLGAIDDGGVFEWIGAR